ncbi:site-specific recombinase, phage integrase [Mycobacteroides abscessus subsp. abscessus]|uniref:tyrosine-type recombinase/integrase n=1 Tax=Mycobacteroides abscessus TaxID=36809 RepID=UPI0009A8EFC7|nr:site-specific integrase [Mycobacteroides abscessus]SLJ22767.1 site-specific recombinase, phage integrase [Mycobacteroides abscessus subsp. abscessus]
MARLPSYITRVEGKRGVRYEARINATLPGGDRLQNRKRFKTVDEARDWHSTTMAELAAGTFTAPSDMTVREAIEAWLTAKKLRVKPTTGDAYTAALDPVVERYGDAKVQAITKLDVELLITELLSGTGNRGVWARTSINPMLARWRKVWGDLHAQGILARNVVALVEPLRKPSGELDMKTDDSLSESEVDQLCAAHGEGAGQYARRRELFVHLALLGLRRGELAGMRWSAVELDSETPTITVQATRVPTRAGVVAQDDAKTISSRRTLPIPPHLLPIFRRVRNEQVHARVRLGERWEGGSDWHLFCHDFGAPLSPRTLNAWWTRSLADAGLGHRRLHASRHTAASLLSLRGCPVQLIAAWLGHADGGVLAMRVYVHTPGAALGGPAALLSKQAADRAEHADDQEDSASSTA